MLGNIVEITVGSECIKFGKLVKLELSLVMLYEIIEDSFYM